MVQGLVVSPDGDASSTDTGVLSVRKSDCDEVLED